jgi:hypothetical protein
MKITNFLKSVILEQSRYEKLLDGLTKPSVGKDGKKVKPKLTKQEYDTLVAADPTTKLNDVNLNTATPEDYKNVKAGDYTQWLIKKYLTPVTETSYGEPGYENEVKMIKDRFMEDLYKVTNNLLKFHRFKTRLTPEQRDINKLSVMDLYNAVKDFSLEKTKASKEEKEAASKTYAHPGADIVFRGANWTVAKIEDKGELGRDAACFYGGHHLEASKGETSWCTSSPGYRGQFDSHIGKGPLYVIIPNKGEKVGQKSGLPADRYQLHFPTDQFMDQHDHRVDLITFLNGPGEELKAYFKPEFAKGLTVGGNKLSIDSFSSGKVGKFVGLYGLDELFDSLPLYLEEFQIVIRGSGPQIKIPNEISKFKNLNMILFDNCISSLPDSICELKNLRFIGVPNNPDLRTIPDCIVDLPLLQFISVLKSDNLQISQKIMDKGTEYGNGMIMFE